MVPVILPIDSHHTPYASIPEQSSEVVRLKKVRYARGYYRMEGVQAYEAFFLPKPITVTDLQVKNPDGSWITLMVDDPLHWLGMKELSDLAKPSRVLVGGLGLGLILHHLVSRSDLEKITVVEIDPEVIKFISPFLPKDQRIEIVEDNFFSYLLNSTGTFDTIIIDLWVIGENSPKADRQGVGDSMLVAYNLAINKYPDAEVLIWGMRGSKPKRRENEN